MKRIRPHSLVALAVLSQAGHGNGHGEEDIEHRRLSIESNIFNKAQLFAQWTAEQINNATPLDLKIDPRSGEGFIVKNDELVSYADMFAATEQRISGATLVKLRKVIDEENLEEELDSLHVRTNRLGSKHKHERALEGQLRIYDLASIKFKSSAPDYQNRILQTDADGFATLKKKPSKKDKKDKDKKNKDKGKKDKGKIKNKDEGGRKKKKKFLPKINSMNPSRGVKILSSHTFSAKVSPSVTTQASIRDVKFRLVDPAGETSDWLPVPQGYDEEMYQITIEGFGAFPASKWKYQMSVYDEEGMSSTSPHVMFKVDSTAGDELFDDLPSYKEYDDDDEEDSQRFEDTDLMEFDVVADSNWPYGGSIQSATGRILFEFNGSGTFVCSGTVVKDGDIKGRSIIFVSFSLRTFFDKKTLLTFCLVLSSDCCALRI